MTAELSSVKADDHDFQHDLKIIHIVLQARTSNHVYKEVPGFSRFKLEIEFMILNVISDFWTSLNIRTFSTHDILKMEHDPTLQRIISLKDQIRPVDTCFNCIIIC